MPGVDYILVAEEKPPLESDREGDQGARFEYVDAINREEDLIWTMQLIMHGLQIVPH